MSQMAHEPEPVPRAPYVAGVGFHRALAMSRVNTPIPRGKRRRHMASSTKLFSTMTVLFLSTVALRTVAGEETTLTAFRFDNDSGVSETVTTAPALDPSNAFFQSLGTNDRACITCHQPADGWTVTPSSIRRRFQKTNGFDPIFRLNDGAVCPTADVSTLNARRRAYDLLL